MQCNSEKSKTWSAANPDKSKFYRARWEANNLQKRKDQAKVWISQNPDKIKANDKRRREKPDFNAKRKARYEANPRPYILAVANRRGKSNAAEGRFTDDDIIRIRNAQKDKCAMCRVKLHGKGHIDHITALIKGGSNWPRNLQLLCKPCNCSKKDRHPIVFAQSRGLLL